MVARDVAPEPVRYLLVRLAGHEYGVVASRVAAMQKALTVKTSVVKDSGGIRRFTMLHGRRLPVVSPHALLGLKERPLTTRSCLLFIVGAPDQQLETSRFALLVDSVSRIENLFAPEVKRTAASAWAEAQIRIVDKWRDVLHVDRMFEHSESLRNAPEVDDERVEERPLLHIPPL